MIKLAIAALFAIAVGAVPNCTEADIATAYTVCDTSVNMRTAYYYYQIACDSEFGPALPQTVVGLPCDIECHQGYYLPFASTDCAACDLGQYSPGGGHIYEDWEFLPAEFRTSCTMNDVESCPTWTTDDLYIHSGEHVDQDNLDDDLYLHIRFRRPDNNKIRFTYKVDAEPGYDGLRFYVDDVLTMAMVSRQWEWTTVEFPVTTGYHDFRWTYHKDRSLEIGEDKAWIRSIQVIGTDYHADSCGDCPTGTYGTGIGNIGVCSPCPFNTHQSLEGQSTCGACESEEIAFSGATDCHDKLPCAAADVFSHRSTCSGGKQTESYAFESLQGVTLCSNLASPYPLPTEETNSCFCEAGTYLSGSSCIACPSGQAYFNGTCHQCPEGQIALSVLEFSYFNEIPSQFTTRCDGDCDPAGWVAAGSYMYPGWNFGGAMDSYLMTNVIFSQTGSISLDMLLDCFSGSSGISPDCSLRVNLNDGDEYSYQRDFFTLHSAHQIADIPAGNYTLTMRFHYGVSEAQRTPLRVNSIRFTGAQGGHAASCVYCPAGQGVSSTSHLCELCMPGQYSPDAQSPCLNAQDGYFTNEEGMTSQIPCGKMTTSNMDHTDCDTDCMVPFTSSNGTFHYDLNPLYDPEVMHYAGADPAGHTYWLNFCSRNHLNSTCNDPDGNPLDTFACQYVPSFLYSVDAGRVIGYQLLTNNVGSGLTVLMTQGTYCPSKRVYRSTTVNMVCDPTAGIGKPVPTYGTEVEYPARSCQYHFTWTSQYACPVCRAQDFEAVVGACVEGKKTTTWRPTINCWGEGPETVIEDCMGCPSDASGNLCSMHGQCDDLHGRCACDAGWTGRLCNDCANGFFGTNCENECPNGSQKPCNGHGSCNSGITGDGACDCTTGWVGESCSVCADGFEGNDCHALPANVTDVVPWWAILIIIICLIALILTVVFVWRAKRKVEYKYSSLLRSQPMGMEPLQDEE